MPINLGEGDIWHSYADLHLYIVKNNTKNSEDDFWKIKKYWPKYAVHFLILLKKTTLLGILTIYTAHK